MSATGAEKGTATHSREEFDGYASVLGLGHWAYEVDDFGIAYGTGRWLPFQRAVRLAPDIDYRSRRNE